MTRLCVFPLLAIFLSILCYIPTYTHIVSDAPSLSWKIYTVAYAQSSVTTDDNGFLSIDYQAEDTANAVSETEREFANTVEMVTRAISLVMWPLLAIAWLAMDNTLVYWELFFLDTTLFQMWQITRTFANFLLWFLFVFAIWYNLVKWWNADGARWLKKFLPNLVIASILIQASYFIIAALLDLSTVMIYSVWGLPLRFDAGQDNTSGHLEELRYVVPNYATTLDNSQKEDGSSSVQNVVYGCPKTDTIYIACVMSKDKFFKEGPEDWSEPSTWNNRKQSRVESRNAIHTENVDWIYTSDISDDYCVMDNYLVKFKPWDPIDLCRLANGQDQWKEYMGTIECPNINDFFNNSAKMTGPFYGLYSSVMRMWDISLTPNHKWVVEVWLEWMMKIFVWLGMLVPLLVLAIVMIIRVVVIWWLLIFVPFMIIVWVIWFAPWKASEATGDGKYWYKSMLGIIFMPIVVVFALSMSLIMMTLLTRSHHIIDENAPEQFNILWSTVTRTDMVWRSCNIENGLCEWVDAGKECWSTSKHCYYILWAMKMCLNESTINFGNGIMNTFTYILYNILGIFLMWTVVFAALKSIKLTEWFVGQIEWFAKQAITSAPILYIPWLGKQSIWSLKGAANEIRRMPDQRLADQARKNEQLFNDMRARNWDSKQKIDTDLAAATDQNAANSLVRNYLDNWLANKTDYTQYSNLPRAFGTWAWLTSNLPTDMTWVFKNDAIVSNILNQNPEWISTFRTNMVDSDSNTKKLRGQARLYDEMVAGLTNNWSWERVWALDADKSTFVGADKVIHLDKKNAANDKTLHLDDATLRTKDWFQNLIDGLKADSGYDVAWIEKIPTPLRGQLEILNWTEALNPPVGTPNISLIRDGISIKEIWSDWFKDVSEIDKWHFIINAEQVAGKIKKWSFGAPVEWTKTT